MATDYLLPCTCGLRHRVSTRQAGDTVTCSCGTRLTVPSMRELAKLEPAADASPVKVKTWGLRQGLMFLGMIIAGIGVLIGSYYSLVAMPSASELEPPANWHELPVEYAVSLWRELRRGMPQRPDPSLVGLVQQRDRAQRGVYVSWMVIATGGIIAASSFFVPRSRLRPQGPS